MAAMFMEAQCHQFFRFGMPKGIAFSHRPEDQHQRGIRVQAEGVNVLLRTESRASPIIFIMRNPRDRYESDYNYRSKKELERQDLYVFKNETMSSFYSRYPNYVVSLIGDGTTFERCYKYSKHSAYSFACAFGESKARGEEILRNILSTLTTRYFLVGLTERLPETMILVNHAFGAGALERHGECNYSLGQVGHKNQNEHTSFVDKSLEKHYHLDMKLYQKVKILFEEQLSEARKIPLLKEQLESAKMH